MSSSDLDYSMTKVIKYVEGTHVKNLRGSKKIKFFEKNFLKALLRLTQAQIDDIYPLLPIKVVSENKANWLMIRKSCNNSGPKGREIYNIIFSQFINIDDELTCFNSEVAPLKNTVFEVIQEPLTNEPKKEVAEESEDEIERDFVEFVDFSNLGTVFEILVKGVSLQDPFYENEIIVYHMSEDLEIFPSFGDVARCVENKAMDILLYEYMKSMNDIDRALFSTVFKLQRSSESNSRNLKNRCKELVFAYMLLMLRGSIPNCANKHQTALLPKILTNNIKGLDDGVEFAFGQQIASFDIRKVKFTSLVDVKIQLPQEIENRLNKGYAGSRTLKLVLIAGGYSVSDSISEIELKHFEMLLRVSSVKLTYRVLHPHKQEVQKLYTNFGATIGLLIAKKLGPDSFGQFLLKISKIPSFQKDSNINNITFIDEKPIITSGIETTVITDDLTSAVEEVFKSDV